MPETECRLQGLQELDAEVLDHLQQMLNENNGYVRIFRSVRETLDDNSIPEPKIVLYANKRPDGEHVRPYNLPANGVIAAIVIRNVAKSAKKNDIVLERKSVADENSFEKRFKINQTNQAYDPSRYPLLFLKRQNGWHFEVKLKNSYDKLGKATALCFYQKLFFEREGEVPSLLLSRDLFQQFFCDIYVKMGGERLSYIRESQQKSCASEYTNLAEKLGDGQGDFDEFEAVRYGQLVVLPAKNVGSDRYFRQKRRSVVAFAVELRHPDIFMTFTCNPKWPEIIAE